MAVWWQIRGGVEEVEVVQWWKQYVVVCSVLKEWATEVKQALPKGWCMRGDGVHGLHVLWNSARISNAACEFKRVFVDAELDDRKRLWRHFLQASTSSNL